MREELDRLAKTCSDQQQLIHQAINKAPGTFLRNISDLIIGTNIKQLSFKTNLFFYGKLDNDKYMLVFLKNWMKLKFTLYFEIIFYMFLHQPLKGEVSCPIILGL